MTNKADDIELLWTELEVFSKVLVRGRNQHRREKYYQMLVRVMKDLRTYKSIHIDRKKVPKLLKLNSSRGNERIQQCLLFLQDIFQFCEVTFLEVENQFKKGLFVPTNLLALASLSRIWYIIKYQLATLSQSYGKMLRSSSLCSSITLPQRLQELLSSHWKLYDSHNGNVDLGVAVLQENTANTMTTREGGVKLDSQGMCYFNNTEGIESYSSHCDVKAELMPILLESREKDVVVHSNISLRKIKQKRVKVSLKRKKKVIWVNIPRVADSKCLFKLNIKIIQRRFLSKHYEIRRGSFQLWRKVNHTKKPASSTPGRCCSGKKCQQNDDWLHSLIPSDISTHPDQRLSTVEQSIEQKILLSVQSKSLLDEIFDSVV